MSLLMVMLPAPRFFGGFISLGSKLHFPLFTLSPSQETFQISKNSFCDLLSDCLHKGRESCDPDSPPAVLLHQHTKVLQVPPSQTHSSLVPPITTFPVVALSATQTKLYNRTSKLSLVKVLVPSKTKLYLPPHKRWKGLNRSFSRSS